MTMIRLLALLFALPLTSAALHAQEARADRAAGAAQEQEKVPQVEEKATDQMFPKWLDAADGKETRRLDLVGLGVRKKTIFRVKVYAFGFYADASMAALALERFADRKRKELMKDPKLDAALLSDGYAKALRLAMARDVDAKDMAEAFEEALEPRIERLTADMKPEQQQAAMGVLKRFRSYFEKEAKEDQVMVFTWLPGGRLQTTIDGKVSPELKSLPLCRALFDVYLGADPISESGKEDIVDGLPGLVKAGKAQRKQREPVR